MNVSGLRYSKQIEFQEELMKVGSLSYGQLMQNLLFMLHSYLLQITIILSVLKSLTILGLSQPEAAQSCEILTLP